MLNGSCLLEFDDHRSFAFEPGDILIVPHVCRSRYRPAPGKSLKRVHALRLLLDPAHVPPLSDDLPVEPSESNEDDACLASLVRRHVRQVVLIPAERNAAIRAVLSDLRTETEQELPGRRCRTTALCSLAMVHVIRQLVSQSTPAASSRQQGRARLVNVTKEYLVKNLSEQVRLMAIARHLDVSPEHLARVFKQETGRTIFEQLEQFRIEQAKTFLLSSDLSVAEIASQTGFSSTSLFSRNFKRRVGASPLRYRQDRWRHAAASSSPGLEPPQS
jgi:AraC-like DNA-binding protein